MNDQNIMAINRFPRGVDAQPRLAAEPCDVRPFSDEADPRQALEKLKMKPPLYFR